MALRRSARRRSLTLVGVLVFAGACGDDLSSTSPTSVTSTGPAASTTAAAASTTPTTAPPDPTVVATSTPSETAPTTSAPPSTTTEETAVPPTTSAPSDGDGTSPWPVVVDDAIADLREMLSLPDAAIDVVSVEEVEWRDGSIGCPEEGLAYTQAIVGGTRIVLRHDGSDYAYHQGGDAPVFHCPADRAASAVPPASNLDV